MIAVSLSFPYEDTMVSPDEERVVSLRGYLRFSARKLSFLYLKRNLLPVPVILYYITVRNTHFE